MVQMMESQCEYFMYFPAVPITDLSEPARYRTLPRRSHLYLGETVRFLLVLRCRDAGRATPTEPGPGGDASAGFGSESCSGRAWRELAGSLRAVASVSPGEGGRRRAGRRQRDYGGDGDGDDDDDDDDYVAAAEAAVAALGSRVDSRCRTFRDCEPLLIRNSRGPAGREFRRAPVQSPLDEPVVLADEVIFPLTVSLDKLPVGTVKVKVMVTVWKEEAEPVEVRDSGYLSVLQQREPSLTFRHDLNTFKAQVSTTLTVLPPPAVRCKLMSVSGRHLAVLKGIARRHAGTSGCRRSDFALLLPLSAEQVVPGGGEREGRSHSAGPQRLLPSRDARRLRAAGGQRLVRMLSALVTTRKSQSGSPRTITRGSEKSETCGVNGRATRRSHRSGEVGMASFCKVDSVACRLPSTLGALEEHDFLFRLHLNDMPQDESNEGMEVPLVAALQWSTPKMPFTNCIYTHYRLPSVRLDRPRFVMTASCPGAVKVKEHFKVKYVLLNNLQDFLSVRLVWTPEGRGQSEDAALSAVVCRTPLSNLGQCRKGCTLTFSVAFQILRPGLYELSQHMKLKLQFTASVSNPPPDARPLSRKNSPSSPAMRDLLDRHQASLGRSQSFSHQQPSRSHIMRTGSAMERRAITPPVGSPVGRPLYLPPQDKSLLSLDKIAKRECKVLVVDPGREGNI
ncbi:trafficking protein particle complex subunit 14-like isoform X2 [Phyllopteryx taeniolatus]|uniref:trafficking protein particle complex subunit 14-like isoform X2 n=1 Tax=Phyllopteryx taeniolatus TaxID=161469 RepID=UPI002AD23666|nr:trafficking protein particle complex subunit 14-like isoform X2 [Phyllopteryx taeniolatus]